MEECTLCANYTYDMEFSEYYCDINMDEDDFMRFISNNYNHALISEMVMNTKL